MQLSRNLCFAMLVVTANPVLAKPITADKDGALGLYSTSEVQLANGKCQNCPTIPQAKWYFEQDLIAVPAANRPVSEYAPTEAQQDVRQWSSQSGKNDLDALPPLVWLGSSQVVERAALAQDGQHIKLDGGETMGFGITPKIPTNLSYYDASTQQFFSQRPLRMRGDTVKESDGSDKFVARTIWPLDFSLPASAPLQTLSNGETLQTLVQAEQGGAKSAYSTRVLWERQPGKGRDWAGKAVVGLMLNGAQGDDDEAHGGHFGVVTGRYEADGNWSRWLVNNFYNLDSFSEKGIVSAVTPMDKYLMDLNNGQSFYRPSYMLVAVLKSDVPARQYQAAINRVYNHFYRHDFVYNHSQANCSGISLDTFRSLGWNVPQRGDAGLPKASAAYVYVAATSTSLADGRKIYDYLSEETTRLYPAVAFDAMGNDLLALAQNKTGRTLSNFEKEMGDNLEALIYVRIPQIPSSRAFGQAPVYSFDQYMKQAPEDRSQWKIVPTEPRPFPAALRDGLALQQEQTSPVPLPIGLLGAGLMLGVAGVGKKVLKKRRGRGGVLR
ncbi:MAG: hypothetical protein PHP57_01875 [Sideroxydans sp.]|nr:hypothetical protein [Sideroxydans sp.]